MAVVVFTDATFSGATITPHDGFARVLHRRIQQSGFELRASLCRASDGWASYLDAFPAGGNKLSELTVDGIPDDNRPFGGDQHDIAAPVESDPREIVRFMGELHRLHLLGHEVEDNGLAIPDDLAPLNDVPLFAERALEWDPEQLEHSGVLLVLMIQQPSIRDMLMLQWASRLEVGDALFDFGEGQPFSGRFTETDFEDLMFGRRPRPNPERIEKGIAVLSRLLSLTTGEHRLPLLVALAWLSWAIGHGSAAGDFLKHAVSINPRYGMAGIVSTLVSNYPIPDWAFE